MHNICTIHSSGEICNRFGKSYRLQITARKAHESGELQDPGGSQKHMKWKICSYLVAHKSRAYVFRHHILQPRGKHAELRCMGVRGCQWVPVKQLTRPHGGLKPGLRPLRPVLIRVGQHVHVAAVQLAGPCIEVGRDDRLYSMNAFMWEELVPKCVAHFYDTYRGPKENASIAIPAGRSQAIDLRKKNNRLFRN